MLFFLCEFLFFSFSVKETFFSSAHTKYGHMFYCFSISTSTPIIVITHVKEFLFLNLEDTILSILKCIKLADFGLSRIEVAFNSRSKLFADVEIHDECCNLIIDLTSLTVNQVTFDHVPQDFSPSRDQLIDHS